MGSFRPDTLAPFLKEAADKLPVLPAKEQLRLVRKAQAGDRKAREKLIKHNLRYIIMIARKWRMGVSETQDLVAEGMMGLDHAITEFDFRRGVKLMTYAGPWINTKMRHRAMFDQSLVMIGKNKQERVEFSHKSRFDPTAPGENGKWGRRFLPALSLDHPSARE